MKLSKQDIKDIKNDMRGEPKANAYYFIVYARSEDDATHIMSAGVFAKFGKLEKIKN